MFDELAGSPEDGGRGAVIVCEYAYGQVILVALVKVNEVFESRALEFVNGLVVVAYDEDVGDIPVVDELEEELVLGAVGVLVFIYEKVQVFFLLQQEEVGMFFEGIQHEEDHVGVFDQAVLAEL